MTAANRIIIYLLRAERARLAERPGTAHRICEIGVEIQKRILS